MPDFDFFYTMILTAIVALVILHQIRKVFKYSNQQFTDKSIEILEGALVDSYFDEYVIIWANKSSELNKIEINDSFFFPYVVYDKNNNKYYVMRGSKCEKLIDAKVFKRNREVSLKMKAIKNKYS